MMELLLDYYSFLREKKEEGKKIIAHMAHDNIPEELIDAAGFFPLNMIFAGDDELMNSSHDYLPPSTCSYVQSCIGLFSQKPSNYRFLDLIDYFIVSNHCVSNICASEIITKYFSIPRLDFYVSYTLNQNAVKYYKLELLEFKKKLEKIKNSEIKDEDLLSSVKKYNAFKKNLSKVNAMSIKGKEKLEIMQKAILYGPSFVPELVKFIQKYENQETLPSNNSKDVILTGCSVFFNDYLVDLIEESGGNVIFFDSWIGDAYSSQILSDDVLNSEKNPLDLIVYRFLNNKSGDHSIPNYLENKINKIEKLMVDYKKSNSKNLGVINHIIKFCDHISISSSFLKERLQEKGIQILNLERDYSRSARGPLETRIQAFLEML